MTFCLLYGRIILSVGLYSISELIPQEYTPPYEEVAEALAAMVQDALAAALPGDSERGKRVFRRYLEQLVSPGGENALQLDQRKEIEESCSQHP
jgi:hypothetical protein